MNTGFRSRVLSGLGALVMAFLLVVPSIGAQQGGTVTGRVLDSQSGLPLAAVQVFISALDLGGLTQQNGRYLLQNVPAGTHTLTVARIGYRTTEAQVSVGGGQTVEQNFGMTEEALQLDEIIVTGTPGGTQRRAIGNSVVTVNASDIIAVAPVSNMQELLSGRTPGLQFTRRTGNVGSGSPIRIRGIGSFALNTNPLIYIDGIRVNNSSNAGPAVGDGGFEGRSSPDAQSGGTTSVLDDLNPDDIESIEIIKGPAAATLYGTEASAGVIQIITKKGRVGDIQINASVRAGVNFMTDPAGRLGTMYGCRSGTSTPCPVGDVFTYNMYEEANRYISGEQEGPGGGQFFNWPTKNLYQYGPIQSYNVDIRGGSQVFRYFASANYDSEEGIEWYNKDETARVRMNLSITPGGDWSLDISTAFVQGDTRYASPVLNQGSPWQDMGWSNGRCLARINPGLCPRLGGFQEHLPTDIAKIETTRNYSRFTGGLTLNHNTGSWLSQRLILGIDKGWDVNEVLFPVENLLTTVYSETNKGQIQREDPTTTNISLDYSVTGTYDYNNLNFQTSVGGQYYIKRFEKINVIGRNFASALSTTVNQTDVPQATLDYAFIETRSLGFYVQEQVGWNGRLFVTGAIRFDDHSAFGADFEALVYPKLSATWVASEESFWNIDLINSFRVRAAWGQAGRQPDVFAAVDVYGVIPGVGGFSGISPVSPGNELIGPEVSTEIEWGFDMALMDGRLAGEFTYFTQKNEDALLERAVAPNSGFPGAVQQNVGRIDNWGWETSLSAAVYEADSWSFDLRLNADHVDNEVKDLGGTLPTTEIREGWPYPIFTGRYLVESADAGTGPGTFSNAMCDSGTGGAAGEAQFQGGALVPCGTISGSTRIMIGRGYYTYKYGIAPSVNLFNNRLQLFALAEGAYGREGVDNVLEWSHIYNNTRLSQTEDDPLYVARDRGNFQDDRSKEYFDGDFWTMRELGFRVTVPQSWVAAMGADRASFSFSARNTFFLYRAQTTIDGGTVGDPELGSVEELDGGSNFRASPPTASISAVLRVSF